MVKSDELSKGRAITYILEEEVICSGGWYFGRHDGLCQDDIVFFSVWSGT